MYPTARNVMPANIGGRWLYFLVKMVTKGAASMANVKLKPPISAKSMGVASGYRFSER